MRKLAALALAGALLAPASVLIAVAALLSPAAQAQCLPGTPTTSLTSSTSSPAAGGVPETARVVLPLPAGTWVRTSGFGMRTHPVTGIYRLHGGLDLAAPAGTWILAAADGRVTFAGPASGYGQLILIDHTVDGEAVTTGYGHMSARGIHVQAGDIVAAGQHIGDVGSEGYATGPHLHFEVRPDGSAAGRVDPEPWLAAHGATGIDVASAAAAAGPMCSGTAEAAAYSGSNPDRLVDDPTSTGRITERTAHVLAQLRASFPESRWSCWSPRPGQKSEHPLGRACDGTFGNSIGTAATGPALEHGWQAATWLQDNAETLGVEYLIWQGRIWSPARAGEGWRPYRGGGMHDPGDVTGGHYDHLHITVAE